MSNSTNYYGQTKRPTGPPYPSTQAVLGGVPAENVDDPICGVLLFFFAISAAAHMTVLQINKRHSLKFIFSGMLFALCVLRCAALSMRIVWASSPHNVDIAIAANILTQAGSILIFLVNLILTQRVVRAYHPRFGWSTPGRLIFRSLLACVVLCLILVITVTVQSFFTLDPATRTADHIAQLFAGTYMALLAFLPIPIVILARILPRQFNLEKFGHGRWRSKIVLLLFTASIATLGAGFRIGTSYSSRPLNDPGWAMSRVCYYIFNYATDLIVSTIYLFSRFDRRFIVPNGAKGPGDYSKGRAMVCSHPNGQPMSLHSNGGTTQDASRSIASSGHTATAELADIEQNLAFSPRKATRDFGSQTIQFPPPALTRSSSREMGIPDSDEVNLLRGDSLSSRQARRRGLILGTSEHDNHIHRATVDGQEREGNIDDMLQKLSTEPNRERSVSSASSHGRQNADLASRQNEADRPPLPPLETVYFHRSQQAGTQESPDGPLTGTNTIAGTATSGTFNSSVYTSSENDAASVAGHDSDDVRANRSSSPFAPVSHTDQPETTVGTPYASTDRQADRPVLLQWDGQNDNVQEQQQIHHHHHHHAFSHPLRPTPPREPRSFPLVPRPAQTTRARGNEGSRSPSQGQRNLQGFENGQGSGLGHRTYTMGRSRSL